MAKEYKFGFVITGDSAKGTKAIRRVREEVEGLDSNTKKAKTSSKEWREETDRQTQSLEKTGQSITRAKTLIVGMTAALGAVGAIRLGQTMVTEFRAWETGLVGVAKTTGLAGQELERFAARIDASSRKIPVSTEELLGLAQAAGQMGVTGADNLEKFSTTIAKLGRASDLAGEEAATSLARILNVTGESIDEIDTLASVIVSLGNNVAASESEIARMTTEVARATSQFGVSSAEAAGLAAAMASIGIRAELGGSSVGRAMQEITSRVQAGGKDLEDFADAIGLNADELKRLFEQDRVAAFEYFLHNVSELGLDAGNALKDVGLGGQEIAKTIIPLSNNMGIFATTMGLAAAEVENATALEREFQATQSTLDSQWEISQNLLKSYRLELAGGLMPAVTDALTTFNEWADTDGPRDMLENLSVGAKGLAAILAGRLAVAAGTSAVELMRSAAAATRATVVYDSMGVAVVRATASQNLMAASSRALSAAMGVLGGPMGVLAIVAGGVFAFREELGLVPYSVENARAAIDGLSSSFEGLTANQMAYRRMNLSDMYESSISGLKDLQSQLLAVENLIASGTSSENLERRVTTLRNEIDTARVVVSELEGKLKDADKAMLNFVHGAQRFVGPLDQFQQYYADLADASSALRREIDLQTGSTKSAAAGVEQFTAAEKLAIQYYKDLVDGSSALRKEVDAHEKSMRAANQRIEDQIAALRQQKEASTMTARAAAIYNAVMNLGTSATAAQIVEVATLTAELFDQEAALQATADANDRAAKLTEEYSKSAARAAEASQRQWEQSRDSLKEYILEFDNLSDTFRRVMKDMAAEWAASGLMNLAGMKAPITPGQTASTGNGLMGSAINASIGALLKGVPGSASFVGPVIPGAAASAGGAAGLGGTIMGAIGAIPGWGWAAMGVAAAAALLNNDDGYERHNAGLLTAPTPGAKSKYTFEVDPFASGFAPTGFARREDQDVALKFIDSLRGFDQTFVDAVEKLGGAVEVLTLHGLNEEATQGSQGTYLGQGRDADIAAQINWFIRQLADNTTGLEQSLLDAVRAAGSADDALAILAAAVEEKAEDDVAAAKVAQDLREAEQKLLQARIESIDGMGDSIAELASLRQSLQMDMYSALGASPLFQFDSSFSGQIAALAQQRQMILSNHREQIRAEEQLHNERMRLAQSFLDFTNTLRLGDMSNLSAGGKFDFAQQNFRALAEAAAAGDSGALKQLQGAADAYVQQADRMFASSGGRKDVVSEVLGIMDALQAELASSTWDPSAANDRLVAQLADLDAQLQLISVGINDSIIAELKNINVNLAELDPRLRDSLVGAISQWVEVSKPEGLAIIESLSGIKGSIDMLPPGIGAFMSGSIGQLVQALLAGGKSNSYIANQFTPGTLPTSALDDWLADQNLGQHADYYTTDQQIADYISSFGDIGGNLDAVAQIARAAQEAGIDAERIAEITGYTKESIIQAAKDAGINFFASGGRHQGGWRVVGEQGPELELTGPSQIFSHNDSKRMLQSDNSAVVAELRALRADNSVLTDAVIELKRIAMADAQTSSQEMRKNNQALDNIVKNTASSGQGVGSKRYARSA